MPRLVHLDARGEVQGIYELAYGRDGVSRSLTLENGTEMGSKSRNNAVDGDDANEVNSTNAAATRWQPVVIEPRRSHYGHRSHCSHHSHRSHRSQAHETASPSPAPTTQSTDYTRQLETSISASASGQVPSVESARVASRRSTSPPGYELVQVLKKIQELQFAVRELKQQLRQRSKEDTKGWSRELKDDWNKESGRVKAKIEGMEDDMDCWIEVTEELQEGVRG